MVLIPLLLLFTAIPKKERQGVDQNCVSGAHAHNVSQPDNDKIESKLPFFPSIARLHWITFEISHYIS